VPLSPVAASLAKVVRGAEPEGLLKNVLSQCEREFRSNLVGFIQNCVGPALVARGLAEPKRARFLALVPYDSFVLTMPARRRRRGCRTSSARSARFRASSPATPLWWFR